MPQRKFRNFVVVRKTDVSVESDFPKEDIIGRLSEMARYVAIHVSTSTKKAYALVVFVNSRYENGVKGCVSQWDVKGYDCFNDAVAAVPKTAVQIHMQGMVPERGGAMTGFKRQVGKYKEKMGALEQEKKGMVKKMKSLEVKNAGLESMVDDLKKKMQDADARESGLEAKNARLESKVCVLEKKIEDAGKCVGGKEGIALNAIEEYINSRFGGVDYPEMALHRSAQHDALSLAKIHEILDPTDTQRTPKTIKEALRIYHPDKQAKMQRGEEYDWRMKVCHVVTQCLSEWK